MKRTKLEDYVTIIDILQKRGPLEIAQISILGNIEKQELAKELDFLLVNRIIEKQDSFGSQAYVASSIGLKIIKYFGQPTVKLQYSNRCF